MLTNTVSPFEMKAYDERYKARVDGANGVDGVEVTSAPDANVDGSADPGSKSRTRSNSEPKPKPKPKPKPVAGPGGAEPAEPTSSRRSRRSSEKGNAEASSDDDDDSDSDSDSDSHSHSHGHSHSPDGDNAEMDAVTVAADNGEGDAKEGSTSENDDDDTMEAGGSEGTVDAVEAAAVTEVDGHEMEAVVDSAKGNVKEMPNAGSTELTGVTDEALFFISTDGSRDGSPPPLI